MKNWAYHKTEKFCVSVFIEALHLDKKTGEPGGFWHLEYPPVSSVFGYLQVVIYIIGEKFAEVMMINDQDLFLLGVHHCPQLGEGARQISEKKKFIPGVC